MARRSLAFTLLWLKLTCGKTTSLCPILLLPSRLESSSKIVKCPEAVDDPKRRKPDIARAKSLLDWEPKVQLWEGLRLTIKAFRESFRNNSILHRPEQPRLHGNQFSWIFYFALRLALLLRGIFFPNGDDWADWSSLLCLFVNCNYA